MPATVPYWGWGVESRMDRAELCGYEGLYTPAGQPLGEPVYLVVRKGTLSRELIQE